MISTTITNTNQKGQLVIPKDMRDELQIDRTVNLLVKLLGKSIVISPIEAVITTADDETSYLDILEQTKGIWKGDSKPKKRKIELSAAEKRRNAW